MTTVLEARQTMWSAFERDKDFKEGYLANIACMLMDAQEQYGRKLDLRDYDIRMAVARRIFDHMYREESEESMDAKEAGKGEFAPCR